MITLSNTKALLDFIGEDQGKGILLLYAGIYPPDWSADRHYRESGRWCEMMLLGDKFYCFLRSFYEIMLWKPLIISEKCRGIKTLKTRLNKGKASVSGMKLRLSVWWTRRDSNPRPPRCERGALPTEPRAHIAVLLKLLTYNSTIARRCQDESVR